MRQSPETVREILKTLYIKAYVGPYSRENDEQAIDEALTKLREFMCAELVPGERRDPVMDNAWSAFKRKGFNEARATMLRNIEEKCR